jgi:hypothetical protein
MRRALKRDEGWRFRQPSLRRAGGAEPGLGKAADSAGFESGKSDQASFSILRDERRSPKASHSTRSVPFQAEAYPGPAGSRSRPKPLRASSPVPDRSRSFGGFRAVPIVAEANPVSFLVPRRSRSSDRVPPDPRPAEAGPRSRLVPFGAEAPAGFRRSSRGQSRSRSGWSPPKPKLLRVPPALIMAEAGQRPDLVPIGAEAPAGCRRFPPWPKPVRVPVWVPVRGRSPGGSPLAVP